MHICEQLLNSTQYLEKHGLTQKQLSSLHHFSLKGREVSFNGLYKYFAINKELQKRNSNFANRVIFVANHYKQNQVNYSHLISQALEKWPLAW